MAASNQQKRMFIFVFIKLCSAQNHKHINKMNILINLSEKTGTIYHSRKDMTKILKVSENTLLNWSKEGIKQTEQFLVCFNVDEQRAKSKRRKGSERNFIGQ